MTEPALQSLTQLPAGGRGVVRRLDTPADTLTRLLALGFSRGVEAVVLENPRRGALIALVRQTRIAIDRAVAATILVEAVGHGSAG